jgi:hypothetical protein
MLTENKNIRVRKDTLEKLEAIANRIDESSSLVARFALYEFLNKYEKDSAYRQYTKKHASGITKNFDTLYVFEDETPEEKVKITEELYSSFE